MVDWTDGRLNHKFWAMVALLETLDTEDFSFCETGYEGSDAHAPGEMTTDGKSDTSGRKTQSGNGIFAQGLQSSKGREDDKTTYVSNIS